MFPRNSSNFLIRQMQPADLAFAAICTYSEGWVSENQATLEGFYLSDPRGCFVAVANERPMGICVATCYGKSGFIGELIVRPEARGKGVGAALLEHGVSTLQKRGAETIYLDGVLLAVGLYERNGFRKVCRSWRFSGNLEGNHSPYVRQMVTNDLNQVASLDKNYFGEDRSFFLNRRQDLFPEFAYVMVANDRICGYILGRAGEDWLSAGPWVVSETADNPLDLLSSLALKSNGRPISIGILETNYQACDLVQSVGFEKRSDSPWRMALGSSTDLGTSPGCYAIGSAAKG